MVFAAKYRRWLVAGGLTVLLILAIIGLVLTRESNLSSSTRRNGLVDQRAFRGARSLTSLATDWDEQRYAKQALRLADHELDLAFAKAFRDDIDRTAADTPEARKYQERITKAEAVVKADESQMERLKVQLSTGGEAQHESLQQQLNLAQAQWELDKDELDEAKDAQARSSGSVRAQLQRLFERHRADEQQTDALNASPPNSLSQSGPAPKNLLTQVKDWNALRDKKAQLADAREDARGRAFAIYELRGPLQEKVNAVASSQPKVSPDAATPATPNGLTPGVSAAFIQRLARQQKNLTDLDKRQQDFTDLAQAYYDWSTVVDARQRTAVHGILRSVLWIVIILLVMYVLGRVIERVFADVTRDRKQLQTLRVVVRFAVQVVGVLVIVFVILGVPAQMATILGLAGAGLTVVLKDFIVAFFGWFVLMGRNGIRVGDWVEINGVVGEVAEITLLRTILLETGNWTDTGHPTGRKVTFLNGFAIEGHFFNFSTVGQWLWDEIEILVPSDQDPYPVIEAIQKVVTDETSASVATAEQEWQRATSRYRIQPISAAPGINLRPTSAGVEVHIRYITRAHERFSTRTKLYQALVDLLHRKPAPRAASGA